jgi:hypothetical protein
MEREIGQYTHELFHKLDLVWRQLKERVKLWEE